MAEIIRSSWNYIPYMVRIIKIYIYSFFPKKFEKFALQPMEISNSHNSGTVKDRGKMRVLGSGKDVAKICSGLTLLPQ